MKYVCIKCGHLDLPAKSVEGSFIGELCLWIVFAIICSATTWLLMLIPLAYTLYRAINRRTVCSLCNSTEIIPEDSPNGKALISGKSINK